jgi:hypothetical protein
MMIQSNDLEELKRFFWLAGNLPAHGGEPMAVLCKKCERWLELAANRAGAVIGHFAPDIRWNDGMLSIATVDLFFGGKKRWRTFTARARVEKKANWRRG